MKLECSVEELKLLFKNFDLKDTNIKIDGAIGSMIAPSTKIKDVVNMSYAEFSEKNAKDM